MPLLLLSIHYIHEIEDTVSGPQLTAGGWAAVIYRAAERRGFHNNKGGVRGWSETGAHTQHSYSHNNTQVMQSSCRFRFYLSVILPKEVIINMRHIQPAHYSTIDTSLSSMSSSNKCDFLDESSTPINILLITIKLIFEICIITLYQDLCLIAKL